MRVHGAPIERSVHLPDEVLMGDGSREGRCVARPAEILGDRYRLIQRLCGDETGEVFSAVRVRVPGRSLGLKVLEPALSSAPASPEELLRDIDAASRLVHPHIALVRDLDVTPDGRLYYVFDLEPGRFFSEIIAGEPRRDARAALDLMREVLLALEHAHARSVVHGALRPKSIFVASSPAGGELARVLDFGLKDRVARLASPSGVPWLAPEQQAGAPADALSDQYAAAALLFTLLMGDPPTDVATSARRPGFVRPPFGAAALDDALARALSPHPRDRFPSLRAFRTALELSLASDPATEPETLTPWPGPNDESLAGCPLPQTEAEGISVVLPCDGAPAQHDHTMTVDPTGSEPASVAPLFFGSLATGTSFGPFVIDGQIGLGGMGMVYRAHHRLMERQVALKVLRPECANQEILQRFFREARVAGRVRHPAVVEFYDFGEVHGLWYLSMELVNGQPLSRILEGERLSVQRVGSIFGQILSGLDAAHEGGVIHRDLKPSNVMIGPQDRVKLLDFGVARFFMMSKDEGRATNAPTEGLTELGNFVGTPAYAAPEQILAGRRIDHRADIYQVGIMLFQVLAGHLPYKAAAFHAMLMEHAREPMPALAPLRPDIPRVSELDQVIGRATAKEPDARYQSAAEFSRALLEILDRRDSAALGRKPSVPARPVPMELLTPSPSSSRRPRAMLAREDSSRRKILLVGGTRVALGRSGEDAQRGVRNDIVLRVMPCRDATCDPSNWAATMRISNSQAEISTDQGVASVRDFSSRGTFLDGVLVGRDRPATLPDAFRLDFGESGLGLQGRLVHRPLAAGRVIDAIVFHRIGNTPEHCYILLASALFIGSSPDAALRLDAPGIAPRHARLSFDGTAFTIATAAQDDAPTRVDGTPLVNGQPLLLVSGMRLELGEMVLRYGEVTDAVFTVP